jgi:toxin ParE1/3/4
MARIIRAKAARADAAEIWAYIAQDNLSAADHLSESFDDLFEKLADLPYMGRKAEELAPSLYCISHGSFLIFYRPFQDGVQIVRILHGAREITFDLFLE